MFEELITCILASGLAFSAVSACCLLLVCHGHYQVEVPFFCAVFDTAAAPSSSLLSY